MMSLSCVCMRASYVISSYRLCVRSGSSCKLRGEVVVCSKVRYTLIVGYDDGYDIREVCIYVLWLVGYYWGVPNIHLWLKRGVLHTCCYSLEL